jgi:hypothetical protein
MAHTFRIPACIVAGVLSAPSLVHGQTALVSWDPHPDPAVTYVVSYGTQPRAVRPYTAVVDVGAKPEWKFTPPLPTDAYYFAVQTKDSSGTVSGYSKEVLLEPMTRVAVSRSAGDLNADGYVDLLWQHQQSGVLQAWLLNDTNLARSVSLSSAPVLDLSWAIVGMGDFTGDGAADVAWQQDSSDLVSIWAMNGANYLRSESPANQGLMGRNWTIRAVGDMDEDGKPDLIWQNRTNAQVAVWIMNGPKYVQSRTVTGHVADKGARLVGAADFDGDRRTDLVWYNEQTGAVTYWLMNGTAVQASRDTYPNDTISDTNWMVRAVTDLNGDRKPDLVWQHRKDGLLAAWLMNGTTIMRVTPLNPGRSEDPSWIIAAPR